MGCAKSKLDAPDDVRLAGGKESRNSQLKPDSDVEAFREKLFANVGTPTTYNPGEIIIEEGKVRRAAPRTTATAEREKGIGPCSLIKWAAGQCARHRRARAHAGSAARLPHHRC